MNKFALVITIVTLASCSSLKVNDSIDQVKKKAESGGVISCGEVVTLESFF